MADRRQIISSIAAIAKRLRRAPSRQEFYSRTGISAYFVLRYFRTWTEAVQAAGVHPYKLNAKAQSRALLEDWGRVARKNRGVIPRHIYLREGNFSPGTLAKRFGGWTAVARAFREFARRKREWSDVVALLPVPLLSGGTAGVALRREPSHSAPPPLPQLPPRETWHPQRSGKPIYGDPTPFRWLPHEPVNEQGVVLLSGMLAKDLGYCVENVQKGFPDCDAMRQIAPGRWQRVSIEFEFESRNFRDHGHPTSGCDLIVCWLDNWPDCPRHIEVLELCRVIKSLANSKA